MGEEKGLFWNLGSNLPFLHAISALPKYPGRHTQVPLWFLGSQIAFRPQLTREHAKMQVPWAQVLSRLQSLSVWHWGLAFTEKKRSLACIFLDQHRLILYHFHKCHHNQQVFLQDKHKPHSCRMRVCQSPHIAGSWSRDCWQYKGFGRSHSCKSVVEDSPCLHGTQDLLPQQLKKGKHMQ